MRQMEIQTHEGIDPALCGTPVRVEPGQSTVVMKTTPKMAADSKGLVHGGFLFGMADYAAMIAVNHPNVVLGSGTVKFLKPVRVHEEVTAQARVSRVEGKKHVVSVRVSRGGTPVLEGDFVCFVLDQHVLDPNPRTAKSP